MDIGLHLIASGAVTVEQLKADAAEAVRSDIHSLWTNLQPGGWDPLTVLPALPGGLPVGTAVVPTYPQHPVNLATQTLTVQALSEGPLTLGIGPSHESVMAGEYGIPYTAPARHTREYLEVLRPLLRGEHVRYSGEFFTVDTGLAIKAAEPSVLVAALGPRMLEVTRDLADGTVAVWVRPPMVADYLVPRLGDGQRIAVVVMVAVTDEPDEVRERIARQYELINDLPPYRAMLDRGGLDGPADALVAGPEDVVAREIARFRDAGVTDLIVSHVGAPEDRARTLDVVTSAI
ncbi:F420-dependent oxidoreductase-like protein [Amycolatopsis bartoniae]|uniref:LLM class F420-dependent oxidoreductase n=1 Tax=Amycolatopsis bartoniae TaxID=941986 RepID=A0A8H9IXK0_9PSEU|nr:TIGR03564 family F420-dependent LLM class oxidoreductase [Amycolatopsis bartoniae]MBB2938966.1 F420-dependent oxidoreductase-like protein [Amycolatopsis bartoniae]TVT11232.1 TIGR03564 family F420-dependent LLM class oxidoreductase [Amycolatopsis bartoniae]GHF65886.1 LLM class F420-dependent oxidoreductase [Amycolatopsis bartoniae]